MESPDEGSARVLLVEDDPAHALLMRETLESVVGGRIEHARTQAAALAALDRRSYDLVVLDAGLPDGSGFEVQAQVRARDIAPEIVFVTSDDLAEHAVDALRAGAAHYVIKRPSYLDQMRDAVREVISRLARTAREGDRIDAPADFDLVGSSAAVETVRREIGRFAATEAPVLITGETGTGKELVARGLHRASRRAQGPFVAVNCAAIAMPLFESEVFGSCKGAYTGSDRTREGLVDSARGGTLFLDEVGELPTEAQAKLLRLVEAGTYRPVGSTEERVADVRILAATNQAVERSEPAGALRNDLYFRLAVLRIHIPPLRERRGDIPALVAHFIARRTKTGPLPHVTPEAIAALMAYDWPGNVRELEHTVARTLLRSETGVITRFDIGAVAASVSDGSDDRVLDAERLTGLLARHGGQLDHVAQELGTSVRTLQRRLKELGLRREDFRAING